MKKLPIEELGGEVFILWPLKSGMITFTASHLVGVLAADQSMREVTTFDETKTVSP
jgi:hypothetical protein